jgi:hypothetical protein
MKYALFVYADLALLGCLGCHAGPPAPPSTASSRIAPPAAPAAAVGTTTPAPAAKPAVPAPAPASVPESSRPNALVIHDGQESWIDAEAAQRSGYTIIDFSDDWTPFIFAPQKAPDGTVMNNRYRRVFLRRSSWSANLRSNNSLL